VGADIYDAAGVVPHAIYESKDMLKIDGVFSSFPIWSFLLSSRHEARGSIHLEGSPAHHRKAFPSRHGKIRQKTSA
jgi:hypothetical protein